MAAVSALLVQFRLDRCDDPTCYNIAAIASAYQRIGTNTGNQDHVLKLLRTDIVIKRNLKNF